MNKEIMELSYEWWTKLKPLWKRFVKETTLCGYDKEDLMQECYLLLVKCLEKFDEGVGVPFESYFKIQLYGWRANQNRRRREMISLSEDIYQQIAEKPDEELAVESQIENRLLFEQACGEVAEMDEMDQKIITQYYFQNKPLKAIAADLNIKYKAAVFRKGKALRRLKGILENRPQSFCQDF